MQQTLGAKVLLS